MLSLVAAVVLLGLLGAALLDLRPGLEALSPQAGTPTATLTPFQPLPATSTPIPSPSETPTYPPTDRPTPSLTPTPTVDLMIEEMIHDMSLRQKVGQMIMTGVTGQSTSGGLCGYLADLQPGAVVYQGTNVVAPQQLRDLSIGLQNCIQGISGVPILIAVDHEGQYVTRFDAGVTVFPAAMAQAATGDPEVAYDVANAAGEELAYSGVNMVLGPVADVLTNMDNRVISQRSFGGDPGAVAEFVSRAMAGYQDSGLVPVLKHFPGHGAVAEDSHVSLPVDSSDLTQLEHDHLPPFRSGILAGAQAIMISHVAFPALDEESRPASISPTVISLLRRELGFDGVALTDSLGMGAITGQGLTVPEASVAAVRAGVDLLLITSPGLAREARDQLLYAVQQQQLSEAEIDTAVRRILRVKADHGLLTFPVVLPSAPDWAADSSLAFNVGYLAVALYRDQAGLVPLPPDLHRVLVVGPYDGWGLYPTLLSSLRDAGYTVDDVRYSGPWNGPVPERAYLTALPARMASYDVALILTWEAHLNRLRYGDTFQRELVTAMLDSGRPVVVVALKSPTDLLEFPQAPTFLATFGTTAGQIQALADVMVGAAEPTGHNPLPGLP